MLAIQSKRSRAYCVLPRREASAGRAATGEEVVPWPFLGDLYVGINGLPSVLGEFKTNGMSGFPLPNSCAIECGAMRGNVLNLQPNDIAAPSMAKLNIAKSRSRPSTWRLVRIDETFLGRSGGFDPINLPLFQGTRDLLFAWASGSVSMLISSVREADQHEPDERACDKVWFRSTPALTAR
jgi:hypothetical protein